MKYFASIAALVVLCSVFSAKAQYRRANYFPDSIQVEFPEQNAIVIFELHRLQNDYGVIDNFSDRLKALTDYVKRATDPNDIKLKRVMVTIKPENEKLVLASGDNTKYKTEGEKMEITIIDLVPQTRMLIRQSTIEQLLPPGWEVLIHSKDMKVTIYAENFEALKSLAQQDFAQVVSTLKADPKMKKIGKSSVVARMIMKENKIDKSIIDYTYPGDLIFITGHTAAGLYANNFYPEFSISIGFYLTDHFNRRNQRIELIYNSMIFTKINENGFSTNVNSFLSAAYSKNFSRTDVARWTTFGAGFLVNHRVSNYFQGNTAKIFFSTDIGSTKLNLVPEFYLTNDFKKFAFGIKLNYTF